jgi:hypothetical protein
MNDPDPKSQPSADTESLEGRYAMVMRLFAPALVDGDVWDDEVATTPVAKRGRGRPKGSKTKVTHDGSVAISM